MCANGAAFLCKAVGRRRRNPIHIERLGEADQIRIIRGDESYLADDPVAALGLVKLIEERGWEWQPSDEEISATVERYKLDASQV